jgi:hypothetical protein
MECLQQHCQLYDPNILFKLYKGSFRNILKDFDIESIMTHYSNWTSSVQKNKVDYEFVDDLCVPNSRFITFLRAKYRHLSSLIHRALFVLDKTCVALCYATEE